MEEIKDLKEIKVSLKDDVVMKLLHYFITEEGYRPILLRGLNNEIWLENLNSGLKIIRINTGHLHNNEQFEVDLRRTKSIMKNIKRKTFSLNMNMLNIITDVSDNVNLNIDDKNIATIKGRKIAELKKNKVVNDLFPKFNSISSTKSDVVEMMALTEEINQKTVNEEKKIAKLFNSKKPFVTYSLIIINILIFLLCLSPKIYSYALLNFSNLYVFLQKFQIYRLITSGFLHANIAHIFFNMYALAIVGKEVEKYYGKTKYLLIYFVSMIVGNLFACTFSNSIGIGASGAIFGLFGALLFFSYNYRATIDGLLKSPIMPTIIINIVLGFMIPGISVSAHIGGLVGGFLASMALGIETKKNKSDTINAIISLTLLILFLMFMILKK